MSILSDRDIRRAIANGELMICGGDMRDIQPASIDVTLTDRNDLLGYPTGPYSIDPENPPKMRRRNWLRLSTPLGGPMYWLQPGEFLLASTKQRISLGRSLVARLDGRSTLGRLGLFVHVSAGYVDPGWGNGEGPAPITLELFNAAPRPIVLRPGMPIGQLVIYRTTSTVDVAYGDEQAGSHYSGSIGTVQAASIAPRPSDDYVPMPSRYDLEAAI